MVPCGAMHSWQLVTVVVALLSAPAWAQKEALFGDGKPPVFREEDMDRRFKRSMFAKMLTEGSTDNGCVQLLGGMFTVLAEIAPTIHARDEKFLLDPVLVQAVNTQLSTPRFPAMAYLVSMLRRVQIDKRLPDEWLATAQSINNQVRIIDMAKLKLINESIKPIDSFYFTLPVLKDRYFIEVAQANSTVTTDVANDFRDTYLDREVAWGAVKLVDTGLKARTSMKKSKEPLGAQEVGAVMLWVPPDPNAGRLVFQAPKPPPPVTLYVHLAPRQFIDMDKVPRGKRMLVKGRFWEMNRSVTEVEVRDALLFEDRDFSKGVILADPNAVASCPAAVNELTGIAPNQPGGFKH